jgi:integrase
MLEKQQDKKKRKRRGQIIPRGPNTFLIRVPTHRDAATGRRAYHNETFHGTPTKAEKRCTQLLAQIDDGSFFQPSNMSVNQLFDKWIDHCERKCRRNELRKITLQLYEQKLNIYLRPVIGALPVSPRYLTPLVMQDLFDALEDRGLAPLTIRSLRAVASTVFRYGVGLKLIKENPVTGTTAPKARRKNLARAMNEAEAAQFVRVARADERGLIFLLWLHTGLRPVEMIGLRWRYLDLFCEETGSGKFEFGLVRVRETVVRLKGGVWEFSPPKTDKGVRDIYIPAWLYYDLLGHKARQEECKRQMGTAYHDHDLVFARPNGEPLYRARIASHELKPLLKLAGLDESYSLYTFRRSFSSLLKRVGISGKEISELMGHSSESFTDDVYVTVYDSAKRETVGALDRVLSDVPGTQLAHIVSDGIN